MTVTCEPGGIGWVDGSHVWTRWYRVGGGIGAVKGGPQRPGGM